MPSGLNFPLFLLSVVIVSLSGVMMPGPVTAMVIARGHRDSRAGMWIGLGHGAIELPLMAAIYLGLGQILSSGFVKASIGFAGGAMMLYLGWQMFVSLKKTSVEEIRLPYNSVIAGLLTTTSNPYFFIWWATIGATLILNAQAFGMAGLIAMAISHWLCDIGWDWLLSWSVFKSRNLWNRKVRQAVFIGCGLLLAGFGVWFVYSALSFITFSIAAPGTSR